jgi:uncharacterized membrane protein
MHNQSPPDETREKKRAQFTENSQPGNKITPALIIVALALIAAAVYMTLKSSSDAPAATSLPAGGSSDLRIPIADISGKAKFFDFKAAGKQVRFFALKSSDGVYRAAMDACDTCWHARKGYRQEGDDMVCNNCGLKFHSALINEVSGGCNPVGIPCKIEGDQLVIKTSDLESRSRYF